MTNIVHACLAVVDSEILAIFASALIGGYGRDYLRMIKSEVPTKISIGNVLVATAASTFVTYGFYEQIILHLGPRSYLTVAFFGGLIGFQVIERLVNSNDLIEIIMAYVLDKPYKKEGTPTGNKQDINITVVIDESKRSVTTENKTGGDK